MQASRRIASPRRPQTTPDNRRSRIGSTKSEPKQRISLATAPKTPPRDESTRDDGLPPKTAPGRSRAAQAVATSPRVRALRRGVSEGAVKMHSYSGEGEGEGEGDADALPVIGGRRQGWLSPAKVGETSTVVKTPHMSSIRPPTAASMSLSTSAASTWAVETRKRDRDEARRQGPYVTRRKITIWPGANAVCPVYLPTVYHYVHRVVNTLELRDEEEVQVHGVCLGISEVLEMLPRKAAKLVKLESGRDRVGENVLKIIQEIEETVVEYWKDTTVTPFRGTWGRLRAVVWLLYCLYYRKQSKIRASLQYARKARNLERRLKDAENPALTLMLLAAAQQGLLDTSSSLSNNEIALHLLTSTLHDHENSLSTATSPRATNATSVSNASNAYNNSSDDDVYQLLSLQLIVVWHNIGVNLAETTSLNAHPRIDSNKSTTTPKASSSAFERSSSKRIGSEISAGSFGGENGPVDTQSAAREALLRAYESAVERFGRMSGVAERVRESYRFLVDDYMHGVNKWRDPEMERERDGAKLPAVRGALRADEDDGEEEAGERDTKEGESGWVYHLGGGKSIEWRDVVNRSSVISTSHSHPPSATTTPLRSSHKAATQSPTTRSSGTANHSTTNPLISGINISGGSSSTSALVTPQSPLLRMRSYSMGRKEERRSAATMVPTVSRREAEKQEREWQLQSRRHSTTSLPTGDPSLSLSLPPRKPRPFLATPTGTLLRLDDPAPSNSPSHSLSLSLAPPRRGLSSYRQSDILRWTTAAIRIQAVVRGYLTRLRVGGFKNSEAEKLREEAVKEWVDGYVEERRRKRLPIDTTRRSRTAATQIQAAWRGYVVRSGVCRTSKRSGTLQLVTESPGKARILAESHVAEWRHLVRRQRAATRIQAVWRGWRVRSYVSGHWERLREWAVRAIQHNYRSVKNRRAFLEERERVTRCQAIVRGWLQRLRTRRVRAAHRLVADLAFRYATRRFESLFLRAVVLAQSRTRGFIARSLVKRRHTAATEIQRMVRGHLCRLWLAEYMRAGGTFVMWAAMALRERERERVERRSARIICAAIRGHQCQQSLFLSHRAATHIQTAWRAYSCRRDWQILRRCVTRIETRFQVFMRTREWERDKTRQARTIGRCIALCERLRFSRQNRAQTQIARVFRGHLARRCLAIRHRAAVRIQAVERSRQARERVRTLLSAVASLQRFAKRRLYILHLRGRVATSAALCIQSYWRSCAAKLRVAEMQNAARQIQRWWAYVYGVLVRRRSAKLLCEKLWAMYCGGRTRESLLLRRAMAQRIQRWYLAHMQSHTLSLRTRAATRIQAHWRMYKARRDFQRMKRCIVSIKSFRKVRLIFVFVNKFRTAAIRAQAAFRGRETRRLLSFRHECAAQIQRNVRSFLVRRTIECLHLRARSIQQWWRFVKHTHPEFLRRWEAAKCIQATFRSHSERERWRKIHSAIAAVQRMWLAKSRERERERDTEAAIRIQTFLRAKLAAAAYVRMRRNVCTLQAAVRRRQCVRTVCREWREAAIRVQRSWRAACARARERERENSALCIQRFARTYVLQPPLSFLRRAAVRIQSYVRMYLARRRYTRTLASLPLLQALVRGHLARQSLSLSLQAAIRLQAFARGTLSRAIISKRQLAAALTLQRFYHCHVVGAQFRTAVSMVLSLSLRRRKSAALRGRSHSLSLLRSDANRSADDAKGKIDVRNRSNTTTTTPATNTNAIIPRDSMNDVGVEGRVINNVNGGEKVGKMVAAASLPLVLPATVSPSLPLSLSSSGRPGIWAKKLFLVDRRRWAAVLIARVVRGFLVRREMERRRTAAVTIQSWIRGISARQSFERLLHALWVLHTRVAAPYREKRFHAAALRVQRVWRGSVERERVIRMWRAAVRIQRWWRRRFGAEEVDDVESASERERTPELVSETPEVRDPLEEEREREKEREKSAALRIQRWWRMCATRSALRAKHSAAERIQAWWRMAETQRCLQRLHRRARFIQMWWDVMRVRAG